LIALAIAPRRTGRGVRVGAGTYYIGVSGFAGNVKYRLRVLPEKP
jgi:hypothetical protein